ncbi:MAG: aminotransferase class III-fold pyridoxal phosphate-dependent enzyme, partial [Candidatus Eremiobacteraeota bacterium]|nr:aminotransferase class III-fold pyridoxal phosphate-dependent enzyme [Candidatus Eremiobacteraeota bacterium]
VSQGLDAIASRGAVFGSTHEDEIVLAERIRRHVPSLERLRFTTTGTEAVMGAVRVARAFTRRSAIVKFGGNYHGHFDAALLGAGASAATDDAVAAGIPAATLDDLGVARYNDLDDLERVLARFDGGARVAAILVEPVVGNMGLVLPEPDFIEGIFAFARACGALVIFDEVITWLRLGLGGAQGALAPRFVPDLTTLGKNLGSGFPLAAFGGRADVMRVLAPEGRVFAGGTHAGNPFSVAIGLRVLDFLEANPAVYEHMRETSQRLAAGIRRVLAGLRLDYAVVQLESIVDFKFRPGPPTRSYDDQARADSAAYAAYYHAMRARGILLPPSQNEVMFLSTEHSARDVDETLEALEVSLGELRERSIV